MLKVKEETPLYLFDLKEKETVEKNTAVDILSYKTSDERIFISQNDAIAFLSKLPSNSVDIIITDPAYSGMNQRLQLGRGRIIGVYKNKGQNGSKWFDEFHDTKENYNAFLSECYRVLKNNRHIYIMFDSYSLLSLAPMVRNIFEVKNLIVWDKANIGLGHYFRRRHEFILFASKGKRSLNSRGIPDVWKIKRVAAFKYPTQKPVEVFESMLVGSIEDDFLVCDPFLGSGSSAIAALKRKCRFIGCDSSENAIKISAQRIKHFLATGIDSIQPKSLIPENEDLKWLRNGKLIKISK